MALHTLPEVPAMFREPGAQSPSRLQATGVELKRKTPKIEPLTHCSASWACRILGRVSQNSPSYLAAPGPVAPGAKLTPMMRL